MLSGSNDSIFILLPLALFGYFGLRLLSTESAISCRLSALPLAAQIVCFTLPATQASADHYGADLNPDLSKPRESAGTNNGRLVLSIGDKAGFTDAVMLFSQAPTIDGVPGRSTLVSASVFNPKQEVAVTSPMLDSITQNTPGYSEGYAAGVPRRFAWCRGSYKPVGYSAPPSDFTAATGWGAIYPKAGTPAYTNSAATIEIANAKTYVRLKTTREWILIQDQATLQIVGSHFVADFSPKANIEMRSETQPGGNVAIGAPPIGYNDHFWFSQRGTFPAGSVDGVYVQMDMRTNDSNISLVANVGADWWRNASADFLRSFSNNPGAGMSNWVELSTEWSTLRFYSLSAAEFQANPPPPLVEPTTHTRLNFTRRFSSASPHCLPRSRRTP